MTTFTFKGNQIGEALQFDPNGLTTTVEIGRVWFAATDTVTITVAPGAFDATGALVGGNGAITALSVTTASGQVTTFFTSPDGLDVDPDQSKQGADYFFISESPAAGIGGAYAGLQLEKIVISDVPLTASSFVPFNNGGGFVSGSGGPVTPPPSTLPGGGTPDNDVLTGTAAADIIEGGAGNDTIRSLGGNDNVRGGAGNDRIDGGSGNDTMNGDAGNDRLIGGTGADRMAGGQGNDVLDGGIGRDLLIGGLGGDTFVFGTGDRVADFLAAQGDQIAFDQALGLSLADITVTVGATDTTVAWAGGSMVLTGVTEPFDLGNAFNFGYQPSFEFV